jgi:ketosteroid isomerase-like protein
VTDNRSVVTSIMAALAEGDGRPFIEAMADDFCWILEGSTPWSGRYVGKDAVRQKLFAPLFAQFATQYRNRLDRIIVDGDEVVVACRGNVETVRGERYDNSYCYWIRMRGGRMVELREYLDTALVERVLQPPA